MAGTGQAEAPEQDEAPEQAPPLRYLVTRPTGISVSETVGGEPRIYEMGDYLSDAAAELHGRMLLTVGFVTIVSGP